MKSAVVTSFCDPRSEYPVTLQGPTDHIPINKAGCSGPVGKVASERGRMHIAFVQLAIRARDCSPGILCQ